MSGLKRHWVCIDGRCVHYRRGGDGPTLLLLHGSPQSSSALINLAEGLSGRFCVIVPDNPGNGLSDALGSPSEDPLDYARALLALMDALGLARAAAYGFHTGAVIAAAAAGLAPARFSALALEGLPVWTRDERTDLLANYLPPHPPQWDGGHLWWAWMRLEQQTMYFPWYAQGLQHRLPGGRGTPERIHANLIDLLDAGEAYRPLYAAAFRADGEALAQGFSGPRLVFAISSDPLAGHLDRLQQQDPSLQIQFCSDRRDADAAIAAFLAAHPAQPAPAPPRSGADRDGLSRGFAKIAAPPEAPAGPLTRVQALAWRGSLTGAGRPLILLHDAGGSSRLWTDHLGEIAQHRPVLAVDLPGHGWSHETDWPTRSDDGVDGVAEALQPAIRDMGFETAAVAGLHLGGQIALALQAASPTAGGAAIIGAPHYTAAERRHFAAHYPPQVGVSPDGGHVLRAWRFVRLQALAFPWFDPSPQAALCPSADALDPQVLHRRAVDLLKAGVNADRAYLSQFAYHTKAAVHRTRAHLLRWQQDPLCQPDRIAALAPDSVADLPAHQGDWARVLAHWRR